MTLTASQAALVRDTFHELQDDLEVKSLYFYDQLFRLDPTIRSLFREDVADQGMRFMSTLSVIVENLETPGALTGRYADLGSGHRAIGVEARHFVTMEDALMATMAHYLGADFTAQAEAAWRAAFREIAARIIASGDIPSS